jgi:putative oxidoreductase
MRLMRIYAGIAAKLNYLQSPFLLAIRLYWGWQFAQTGWGKMHNIAKITGFFMSLNIPFPAFSACFISGLGFFGGLLLIRGLASSPTGFLLAANMLVAYLDGPTTTLLSQSSQTRGSSTLLTLYLPFRVADGANLWSWALRPICLS